ncbi:MarR family winged helix-turn-helix transcriptional regulator [Streptomyces sp. ME19-01-6]|uniref:MarR family winged helix-turn-helix transcriptional regulator n=1 Tax=Streptomyces sp. ME19-01-6 TaxID=3028686 RepID=UPI0029A84FDE|nr:MarR family winged helix-turn-helix transcriptional regulator [Streptomyces sp. ME19-01-6]MDX3229876.1 MarR family winged helix-turn-helix transcriptional regulator [Streptomyces sp. ME19-01-6]
MTKRDAVPGDENLLREARELTPALHTLARVLRLRGVAEAGLFPLPPSDLEVLRYVLDSPGTGTGTLARELGLHASNVSTTVRGLVAQGLIRREPDPHDRRAVRLYPTLDAEHGMTRIEAAWAELFADALAALSPDHRTALAAATPALRALGSRLRGHRKADT